MSAPAPRRAAFKQADVTRAITATQKAGLPVRSIRIEPNGAIAISCDGNATATSANPWDVELQ